MENLSEITSIEDEAYELPPGFRFHPTDLELVDHYLPHKFQDRFFKARAIGEVDLNSCEPWELRSKAKMGEKEWYFFCVRDRKYPTGLRTNRATEKGYWKATGKDKEIYKEKMLVGMKKTLVFYNGRAPKGVKSNWVMHEYRLEGRQSYNITRPVKNEWVICRVFHKNGKRVHISGPETLDSSPNQLQPLYSPPPMESSPEKETNLFNPRVPCFSIPMEDFSQNLIQDALNFKSPTFYQSSLPSSSHGFFASQGPVHMSDPAFLYMISQNQNHGVDFSSFTSNEQIQASLYGQDGLWNY